MVLEMAEGMPIHKILQMNSKLSFDFSKLIITQLLHGLMEFHSKGYIYRDIKASNLVVNCRGKLMIIDFGFSKKIDK